MMETNNLDKLINPTQLAQKMAYWTVDLEDAARYLHEGFPIRSIDEVIDNTIQRKAQVSNCTEAEIEAALGNCVGSQNLRNWRTPGNSKSLRRDSAMKIAFALGMSYEEAEEFLKRCWLDGFYMRDVQDIIYRHGLEHDWSYEKADKLAKDFALLQRSNETPDGDEQVRQEDITRYLGERSADLQSEEDLKGFIEQNQRFFGSFRRKAYQRFTELYDELQKMFDDTAEIDRDLDLSQEQAEAYERGTVSMAEICNFIVGDLPKLAKHGSLSATMRSCIAGSLPTRTAMSAIINRYERKGKVSQVDRKLLLLAYLASEGGETKEYSDKQAAFMEHLSVINTDLLEPLGMAALDSRHPFDWIVMNALSCAYVGYQTDVNERMTDLVEVIREREDE